MAGETLESVGKFNRVVVSALQIHVVPAARGLDGQWAGDGSAAGSLGSMAQAVEQVARSLESLGERLRAQDGELARELAESSAARKLKEEAQAEMYDGLSTLARGLENTYGAQVLVGLHLSGPTPVQADALVQRASDFLGAAQTMPPLPKPLKAWSVFSLDDARADIQASRDLLQGALGKLSNEERETESARSARRTLFDQWRAELRFAVALGRAVLRRAGQASLADKLLPTERQAERLDDQDLPNPDELGAANPT